MAAGPLILIGVEASAKGRPADRVALSASAPSRKPHFPPSPSARAQRGLGVPQQHRVPLVRKGGAAEAGELPHRPELAAVHRRMNAAGERILAGAPELTLRVEAIEIGGGGG